MDSFPTTTTSPTATATSSSSSPSSSSSISLSSSLKRVKLSPRISKQQAAPPPPKHSRWKTPAQEKIYGQRLLEALQRRLPGDGVSEGGHGDLGSTGADAPSPPPPRVIKEAADSALAMTARGQSRWSRAILTRRWRLRKMVLKAGGKVRRKRAPRGWGKRAEEKATAVAVAVKGGDRCNKENKKVSDRLRLLSRLVPGCRKASTPCLLEETADYVAALELQVKAMKALAEALSAAAAPSSASGPHDT